MNNPETFSERADETEHLYASHPVIRAVNFHNSSKAKADQYEQQLARYSKLFTSVNEEELDGYLATGKWTKSKPGLIVSIFEGYRNGYDVLLPLVEKYGFTAWFFVITGFINADVKDQLPFALGHDIDMLSREYKDGRYALTWEELRRIDKKHVIACHSRSHQKLSTMPLSVLSDEIVGSQDQFRKHLGHPVRSFVSLTGPTYGEFEPADRLIEAAGFDFVFSNFQIQRLHPLASLGAKAHLEAC